MNSKKPMVPDSKLLSERFNANYDRFFKAGGERNISQSFYAFGVLLRSKHLKDISIKPYNPKDFELVNDWDLVTWVRVTWGTNDEKTDDEYEKEFDDALTSTNYYTYLISQAVRYHRPTWSIFGLIGMMQGGLNQNQYQVSAEDVFTASEFLECLNLLPSEFIENYHLSLVEMFDYFDECGLNLKIDFTGSKSGRFNFETKGTEEKPIILE